MSAALRLILGDQLNTSISSLSDADKENDIILICEVYDETTYVRHHKKKIAFLFSAMRHFAEELKEQGYNVAYTKIGDNSNAGSFKGEVKRAIKEYGPDRVIVTEPGEYRVLEDMRTWEDEFGPSVEIRNDDRFLCTHKEFADWAEGRKELRMEFFYREMRRKYDVLMDGDKPEGGEWNYDSDNRKQYKDYHKAHDSSPPTTYSGKIDEITQEAMDDVAARFDNHFGTLEPFYFAVTRDQALYALNKFIKDRLGNFGDFQDVMVEGEPWLYHSHISFYINCGMLLPKECIDKAEEAYREGEAPLNAVEGFIRQILGWREYIRGLYWLKMPDYESQNFLNAQRKLPDFFWTAETDMNCLKQCVSETRDHAYAHHIQRLMVLGNFCLIAGIDPAEVNEWYLIVYADAYQWVELPNVTGMILFADGGVLASKPYAASGSYINKMSNYCKNCRYKVKEKNGEDACPFNYLYWDFLMRNEDKLKGNHRMGMVYNTLSRMKEDKIKAIKEDSRRFLESLS